MPDGFKSLREVYRSEPQLRNVRRIVKSSEVVLDFYKIFPDLEKIAKPQKVDKMFLKIKVENAVWRSELKFKEQEIVKKINKYYNEERIKRIKFIN
jgi:hypothetical protein